MVVKTCFTKTNAAAYCRIQSTGPNVSRKTALGLLLSLFLPLSSFSNESFWNLSEVSIPLTDITDPSSSHVTGPTVFGITLENPAGTYIAYPEYFEGPAPGGHQSVPVKADLRVVAVKPGGYISGSSSKVLEVPFHRRIVGEPFTIDTVSLNNHNGANHIWLNNQVIAYHKKHLRSFSIYDVVNREFIAENVPGELAHASYGGLIYMTRDNGGLNWREKTWGDTEYEHFLSDCPVDDLLLSGHLCYPRDEQGVYVYHVPTAKERLVVTKEDVMRYLKDDPGYEIEDELTYITEGELNHADPAPSSRKVTFLYNYKGETNPWHGFGSETREYAQIVMKVNQIDWSEDLTHQEIIDNPVGVAIEPLTVERPFHALWFDDWNMLASRPRVRRTDLTGRWIEDLGGSSAHQGMSTDREWFASDMAPKGEYEHGSNGTEIYLHKRGQNEPIASFARWWGDITWDDAAHANPSFSADGNRLYFAKGGSGGDSRFDMHYVDLTAYRKTLHKYCGAGAAYQESGANPYLSRAVINDATSPYDVEPELLENKVRPPAYSSHGCARNEPCFIYGAVPDEQQTSGFRIKYPAHGYDVSPPYVWDHPKVVSPGDELVFDGIIKNYFGQGITMAIDWNQDGEFSSDERMFRTATAQPTVGGDRFVRSTFTVPDDAAAGDTMGRIRLYKGSPDLCGMKDRSATYDFPIVVKVTANCENCCTGYNGSEMAESPHSDDADSIIDDPDWGTEWNAKGANEWVKVCFRNPRNLRGAKIDFIADTNQTRRYKFDLEGLHEGSSRWIKLLENTRSLGRGRVDERDGGFDQERYVFSGHVFDKEFVAFRYVGYGNDCAGDGDGGDGGCRDKRGLWNNVKSIDFIGSDRNFKLTDDAHVRYDSDDADNAAHGWDTDSDRNYGRDGHLRVSRSRTLRSDSTSDTHNSFAYVRFDHNRLPGINGVEATEVQRATLRLKVAYASSGTMHKVSGIFNDWDEDTITFNNKPAPNGGSMINAMSVPGVGQWLEVDVTKHLNAALDRGDSAVTFRIMAALTENGAVKSESGTTAEKPPVVFYHAKDEGQAREHWPQLVYVVAN